MRKKHPSGLSWCERATGFPGWFILAAWAVLCFWLWHFGLLGA